MDTSCFASENCSMMGSSDMNVDQLLATNTFVAVDEAPGPHVRFVGCVSVSTVCLHHRYPSHTFPQNAFMVSNLCVAEAYRKHGLGKRLIYHAVAEHHRSCGHGTAFPMSGTTYMQIALHDARTSPLSGRANEDCTRVFDRRVERLLATYAALGFVPVDRCNRAILLRG